MKVSAAVYVVHNTEESSVRSLTFQLSRLLSTSTSVIPVRQSVFVQNISALQPEDMIVAIGNNSFREACSVASKGAIVGIFIGKEEYLNIQPQCSIPSSAVFSGAPLEKRLSLLQAVWFDPKPLIVLHSNNLLIDQQGMQEQASVYGFTFRFLQTEVDQLSVLKAVNYIMEDSTMMFSLVDSQLYENGIAQDILKLLFHKQKLMIGPSLGFVKAGSLFAIYSDTETKLDALAARINGWQAEGTLLDAVYPDQLRVSFNPYLIKSHGIVLPSAAYLKDQYGLCSESACN
ncbi:MULTISPECIES: hypothetical protein [Marinomonas]|uniref:Uncharacterized protein n=1 Tax=Marinomonas alcarazii TaxID=491949 RepID=A0A318V8G9_9GAMM|nr:MULTISPECIES: hypothetical protein [Marinomonas]PYF84200.1 hypothetical protein DFP75_101225 [Marinomonas alcarazii]